MPRKGRIRLVGKWEKFAAEERERELRDLADRLRTELHYSKAEARKDLPWGTSN
ncbi:hypothetical protein [Micromonospora zhanjiangensis]